MIAAQFSQLEIKAQAKPWTQLLPWEPNIGASALSRALHIETFAACLILTKIAKPDLRIDPTLNDLLFRNPALIRRDGVFESMAPTPSHDAPGKRESQQVMLKSLADNVG